jgi:hypothetical protein
MGGRWDDGEGTLHGARLTPPPTYTQCAKPEVEVVRVVPKGDERVYPVSKCDERAYLGRNRVGVPTSSSVYSRSVDGVTVY